MKRNDIVQAGVIGIGGAATLFALVFAIKFGASQESLFALIGSLIGAATTIVGAVWLADRNRNVERDAEAELLAKEYGKLLTTAMTADEIKPEAEHIWPEEYRPRLAKLAEEAGNVHAIGGEALSHGKALSFIQRASVRRVQFAIHEYLRFWTDANAERDLEPWDDRSFPAVTADIIQECRLAIGELGGTAISTDEA